MAGIWKEGIFVSSFLAGSGCGREEGREEEGMEEGRREEDFEVVSWKADSRLVIFLGSGGIVEWVEKAREAEEAKGSV